MSPELGGKIIFITGGARSGKTAFALRESSEIPGRKAYIATAEVLDAEMKARVDKHRAERDSGWDTYEEPLEIAGVINEIDDKYSVIVVDCLTLWLSNILHKTENINVENSLPEMQPGRGSPEDFIREFTDRLKVPDTAKDVNLFIVSNEIGMGIVPGNRLARRFRDIAGFLNQEVAAIADDVYLVTAGIPVKIK
ncbi:MAG: bifunctional adenosylcobinamide kinase/adenosylcobinamide-phosphate guanylyltransferase [Nitrospirota bacterium]|nr:bifunctional adenosylcobinamide kinase/adenosylcobinamide-phosphate guanylyltransferase [Nitrospirota bacterium]